MAKIKWHEPGSHWYQAGVDRGVLYVSNQTGVPWNGLVSVTNGRDQNDPQPIYLDGEKILNLPQRGDFKGTIEAYYSPPEFDQCEGFVSPYQGILVDENYSAPFSLTYRTLIGNDTEGVDLGYKIHLIYNAIAIPADRTYSTIEEKSDVDTLSWNFTTTPIEIPNAPRSSHLIINSVQNPELVERIERVLYGTDTTAPRMPLPSEIYDNANTGGGGGVGVYDSATYDTALYA